MILYHIIIYNDIYGQYMAENIRVKHITKLIINTNIAKIGQKY